MDPSASKKKKLNASRKTAIVIPEHAPQTQLDILWKIINILIFIYMASIAYQNIRINGVAYGGFLKPIAALSPYPLIFAAFLIQFFLQRQKMQTALTVNTVTLHTVDTLKSMNQRPLRTLWIFVWRPILMVARNALFFFLLMIPLSAIIGLAYSLLNWRFTDVTITY